jgi:hypothetical protein
MYIYIIRKDFYYGGIAMDSSFGQSVLSLYTLIEGKTLSYGYSNREIPNEVRDFQNLFRSKLISYIEDHDKSSRCFLELCVDHVQDILDEKFMFLNREDTKANV